MKAEQRQTYLKIGAAAMAGLLLLDWVVFTPAVAAWREQLPTLIRVYGIILTLVLLVAVVGIGNPAFLSGQNIFNMLSQWAPAGIMAVGMTFVILTGGFDLSVASGYSLCAVVAAYVGQSYPPSIAFAAAIAVGLLFGLANGLLVAVVVFRIARADGVRASEQ